MSTFAALAVFTLFVVALLAVDLGLLQRRAHSVGIREATIRTFAWMLLALLFNLGVWAKRGPQPALEFLGSYILEQSLSVDNVFVFAMIFGATAVPVEARHKVLFWGVLGALGMRAVFIAAGLTLISYFRWVLYVFGFFLIVIGVRMFGDKRQEVHPDRNPLLRAARKIFPVTADYEGTAFFTRRSGRLLATPLFFVLLMVESTDLVFALDSIPAVFAVTQDPFVAYTSNALAVLGLRSLYFVVAAAIVRFRHLQTGLAVVLVFLGVKTLAGHFYKLPIVISLLVICAILSTAIITSLRAESRASAMGPPA